METAVRLSRELSIDTEKVKIASLAHDIAREIETEKMIALASKKFDIENWEKSYPLLLHGKAGAVLVAELFSVNDVDILEAIAWHTTGKPGMSDVAKIVFIADYIEPGRDHLDGDLTERLLNRSLDEKLLIVVKERMDYNRKRGNPVTKLSQKLYEELRRGVDTVEA